MYDDKSYGSLFTASVVVTWQKKEHREGALKQVLKRPSDQKLLNLSRDREATVLGREFPSRNSKVSTHQSFTLKIHCAGKRCLSSKKKRSEKPTFLA